MLKLSLIRLNELFRQVLSQTNKLSNWQKVAGDIFRESVKKQKQDDPAVYQNQALKTHTIVPDGKRSPG